MGPSISSCTGERVGVHAREERPERWTSGSVCLGRKPSEGGWPSVGCFGSRELKGDMQASSSRRGLAALCIGRPVAAQYARIDHLEQQINLLETRRQLVHSLIAGGRSCQVFTLIPDISLPRSLDDWATDILRERSISEAGITHDELVEALMQFNTDDPGDSCQDNDNETPMMRAEDLRQSWPHILERVSTGLDERASDLRMELQPLVEDVTRTEKLIEDAFSKIDREHKGFITHDDLRDLCEADEDYANGAPALATNLFAALDSDRTGRVSREDFRLQMTSGALEVLLRQIDKKKEERQRYRYFPPSLDRWGR